MKSEEDITKQAQELYEKLFHKYYDERKQQFFRNCKHNHKINARGLPIIHYCNEQCVIDKNNVIHKLFICNNDQWAQQCDKFKNKHDEEEVRREFENIIKDPVQCGKHFPSLAALLWVINDKRVSVSWWKRLIGKKE